MTDKIVQLTIIQNQAANCNKCNLHKGRTNSVFSRGNPLAKVMIVGEGPGQEEDLQGKPFVGKSGQLLDTALFELGLDLDNDIYVCNIVKCRPPGNRTPTDDESNTCFPYLEEQIKIIKPQIIIALGSTAMNNLINTNLGITKNHGTIFKTMYGLVMPIYHPSYVLRGGGYKSNLYQVFKSDIKSALEKVNLSCVPIS